MPYPLPIIVLLNIYYVQTKKNQIYLVGAMVHVSRSGIATGFTIVIVQS